MITEKIYIIHLEDLGSDADLVRRELKKSGMDFELTLATNEKDFEAALDTKRADVILSDHSLPAYSSFEAFKLVKQKTPRTPFILVTATVSEEFAVKMMKEGVEDYILKDRLQRLPGAIVNALEKTSLANEKEKYLNEIVSQEKKFRAMIENMQDIIVLADKDFKIFYRSPATYRIFDIDPATYVHTDGLGLVHPDDAALLMEKMNEAVRSPGLGVPVVYRLQHPSGRYVWLEGTIMNLLHDESVNAILINLKDISAKREAEEVRRLAEIEKEKMTSDLIQHNKNLEQFAYIISHNLRSPVANILGLSYVLKNSPGISTDDFMRCLDGLITSVQRLDDIIIDLNNILQKRRDVMERREKINLDKLVTDIKMLMGPQITGEQVTIETDFAAGNELYTIKSYLHSIFFNLITNSIKYRKPGQAAVIHISSRAGEEALVITFNDNGMGIDLDRHGDKIFGLYKKFHILSEGKGMGLYMVKTQVELLGGKISVSSQVDQGTTFVVEFAR